MMVRFVRRNSGMIGNIERIGPDDTMDIDVKVRELWTATLSAASFKRRLPLVSYITTNFIPSAF